MFENHKTAHIAVHVQTAFFNPPAPRPSEEQRQPQADACVRRIDNTAKILAGQNIPTLWIQLIHKDMSLDSRKLYGVTPRENDMVFRDVKRPTALTRDTVKYLEQHGIKTLLVSGGYASQCVTDFVRDAIKKGFDVHVMEDCLMDNQNDMDLSGMYARYADPNPAKFTTSEAVLHAVAQTAISPAAIKHGAPETPATANYTILPK